MRTRVAFLAALTITLQAVLCAGAPIDVTFLQTGARIALVLTADGPFTASSITGIEPTAIAVSGNAPGACSSARFVPPATLRLPIASATIDCRASGAFTALLLFTRPVAATLRVAGNHLYVDLPSSVMADAPPPARLKTNNDPVSRVAVAAPPSRTPDASADSVETRAETLAKRGDVRALEILIQTTTAEPGAHASDDVERLRQRLVSLLNQARKNRLELDRQALIKQSSR